MGNLRGWGGSHGKVRGLTRHWMRQQRELQRKIL